MKTWVKALMGFNIASIIIIRGVTLEARIAKGISLISLFIILIIDVIGWVKKRKSKVSKS